MPVDTRSVVQSLREMVAFPTVSSEPNLAFVDYLQSKLESLGFETKRTVDPSGQKANLVAHVGPAHEGGILLAGHTDVVPVAAAEWNGDPFELQEGDGQLQGRGVSDMKGFWALVLTLCEQLDLRALRAPLSLAMTYDEEIGCGGAKLLAKDLAALSPRPSLALLGEPTSNEVVVAHKGIGVHRTVVTGRAAHASRPRLGASALHLACELVTRLPQVLPDASDERFDPPHATANVGLITGGVATNVIADSCAFEWEARTRTVEEMEQIRASWRRLVDEVLDGSQKLRVETELVTDVPGLQSEHNGEAARIVCAAMGRDGTTTAPFVTEGGIYDSVGIPSIVCGPGAIEEAHQTNEKLSLASLEEYGAGLERLLEESLLL